MNGKTLRRTALSIGAATLPALLGAFFMDAQSPWFASLSKPGIMPQIQIVAAIWDVSLIFAAISAAFFSLRAYHADTLFAYVINGLLQALWGCLIGQKHMLESAFGCLLLLLAETYMLYRLLHKRDKTAAYLLIPHILWLLYACALNYALIMLNA